MAMYMYNLDLKNQMMPKLSSCQFWPQINFNNLPKLP